MRGRFLLSFLLISILFVAGCTREGQRPSVEDLSMVSSLGFDFLNKDEIRLTATIPQPPGESPVLTEVYSVNSELIHEGLVNISSESDKMIILNQLRTILFNEEFAKSGKVTKVVEHFYRDSTVGNKVRLIITKETAEEILKGDYPENQHLDAYLNDLLQPKLHNSFSPFTSINDYIMTQTSPIFHTMVPYMEKKEKSLKVTGVALFNEERMIGIISTQESLYIQALQGKQKLSPISIKETKKQHRVFIEDIKNKLKVKSNRNIEAPHIEIHLKLEGVLVEYEGKKNLSSAKEIKKLEKEIAEYIQKDIEQLLKKLQEHKVDPVGFSEYFRMHYKGKWTKDLTEKIIDSTKFDVHVELNLLNSGTLK